MERENELDRIKDILKISPKGLTIEEVSKKLSLNRATAAKYLNSLVMSGQADLRELGRAKLFHYSQRLPLPNLLSLASDLILILDKDLFIQEANDPFLASFQVSKEDLKGKQLEYTVIASYFAEEHFAALQQALDGTGSTFEIHIERNGDKRYFRMKIIPLVFEAGGRAVGIIFEDITEMKRYQQELEERVMERTTELVITNNILEKQIDEHLRAQDALKESEANYRRIVETANEGIWVIDKKLTITFANQKMTDILHYPAEEMMGRDISAFIFQEDSQDHALKVRNRKAGLSETYERRFRRKDDSECWMLVSAVPIHDTGGQFNGSFAMLTDITDRKQLESELERKSRYYELLLQTSTDAIHIVDKKGNLREWNNAFLSHLGYSPTEAAKLNVVDWDTEVSPDQVRERIEAGNVKSIKFETHHRRKDGTLCDVEVNATRIIIDGEDMIYASARDITERRQAEEAIKKANNQVSLLTSITRHDILNQLSMLDGYISLLKEPSEGENLADLIQKEETIVSTIRRQIVFTRDYQNVGAQTPQWKNIKIAISTVLATMDRENIYFEIDTDNLEIYADFLIEKVFFNLIENALRHGEHVTRIRVSYQQKEDEVVLSMEDDGIGIPEQDKEKIFTRGFGKNTGYGLFLAREILAITGITIRETGVPGKGARFEMNVPKNGYRFTGD
ncbi:MAG TPA: PAS domain S-box protein [Methanoregula sp.]|nr:PAS domain S-box protein [Methanoregula sp.]